ncbi:MAG: peptidylprolyl isomerase [Calothrix sp. MO_192.B10]|nr:peptidylprolyl isomerase [Calothrix sp. MO_192.B10]
MSKLLKVSGEEIINYLKISCQMPETLEAIATRKIITEASAIIGIQAEIEEIQQEADNFRIANQLIKTEDTWSWLKQYHLSLDDFEELNQTNLLSSKLANHLFAEQVEPFFYQHQLDYTGAVTYEVVVDDEDLALELFYALQEGEISFQEIARQYIQEPEIRRAGGYQGIKRRTDFKAEIAASVFAATPPQIIKPIVTSKGVHLIWVEEIIYPELNEELRLEIMADLFHNWLKQQLQEMEIVMQIDGDNDRKLSSEHRRLA